MATQRGFFDEEIRLRLISQQGDPLVKLNERIQWENFRKDISHALKKVTQNNLGRPPYDYIMMFKILILQRLYNFSDSQTQYQILDRLSFSRFLGLGIKDNVPDEKTIWLFRERLTQAKAFDRLFRKFLKFLEKEGIVAHEGSIVDATFVEVPRQHNTSEEQKEVLSGKTPIAWEPEKVRQKDVDARWAIKNREKHFGYKNHIKICRKSKIICSFQTTSAEVHDSQALAGLLEKTDKDKPLFADSAYSGKPIATKLKRRKIENKIHEKGYRNNPLTEEQKSANQEKSKVRARVEHVFGYIKNVMKGRLMRYIGLMRTEASIALTNLTYNMCRYVQLKKA